MSAELVCSSIPVGVEAVDFVALKAPIQARLALGANHVDVVVLMGPINAVRTPVTVDRVPVISPDCLLVAERTLEDSTGPC